MSYEWTVGLKAKHSRAVDGEGPVSLRPPSCGKPAGGFDGSFGTAVGIVHRRHSENAQTFLFPKGSKYPTFEAYLQWILEPGTSNVGYLDPLGSVHNGYR